MMGKFVNRNFVKRLTCYYYQQRKDHTFTCVCVRCRRYQNLLHEKDKWSFDGLNSLQNKWFFIFNKKSNSICLFPVFV